MIQINCIFINLKQQECRALDKLYCVSEDKCSFCKLNNEYNHDGTGKTDINDAEVRR